jgi:hypothetical protein
MNAEIDSLICALEKCKSKCMSDTKYCKKHQINIFLDKTKALNKRPCANYIRKCRSQLDESYTKKKCENCLSKERIKDKTRRGKAVDTSVTENNTKKCSKCNKEKEINCFQGEKGGITKTCDTCRENNKKQDENRDKEHRNTVARVAEQKPARIAVKKAWAENNHEKVVLKNMNYRQRQIENDVDGYQKRQAENAKKWREKNQEKVCNNNIRKRESIDLQYNIYKRSADQRNIEFCLDFQLYESIVRSPCVYCNEVQERGFNGIDRVDSAIGYVESNCKSCCKMCNYMKGCCGVDYFLKKIEHILTFNGKISGKLCYEIMPNTKSRCYSDYKRSAITRNKSFEISKEVFDKVRSENCYLCGKQNSINHKNGIDRVDNAKGYVEDNIKSCCSDCNYLKRDYELDVLFDKLCHMYENEERALEITETITNNHIVMNHVKIPKEVKQQQYKINRIKKNRELKDKYCDEEYKNTRAKELAKMKKCKNQT